MVDFSAIPIFAVPAQTGYRKIVDIVGNGFFGADVAGPLHLGHDHANVGHGDDVAVWLAGIYPVDKLFYPRCSIIPAFAVWRCDIAGVVPVSTAKFRVFLADFVQTSSRPNPQN